MANGCVGFCASPSRTSEIDWENYNGDTAEGITEDSRSSEYGLTISLPSDEFDEDAIDRLKKLIAVREPLIRKAMSADRTDVDVADGEIEFRWWDEAPDSEYVVVYTRFLSALCKFARAAKRVYATSQDVDSEKYAFRAFLLRLGYIGAEFADDRRILIRNLSGSAAFRSAEKAQAFAALQKAKKAAGKN